MKKYLQAIKRKTNRRSFLGNVVTGLSAVTFRRQMDSPIFARVQEPLTEKTGKAGSHQFGFVIHGGAGVIRRGGMTPEMEKSYRVMLSEALTAGYNILNKGGRGLDAVEAAIRILEDSPLFNAGKGAVFTNAGTNELDASVMDGKTLKAGAVAAVKHIKNPISLARLVMERSPHVMMVGDGAETFAQQQGIKMVPQLYFFTEKRWQDLQRIKEQEKKKQNNSPKKTSSIKARAFIADEKYGTVGAVALDKEGNLAAGTSTGGLTNKKFGRVGDSPIIGAGTYANNQTCAVSATGDGEYFIRSVVAHDISALVEYQGLSIEAAAQAVIAKVGNLGGEGGVIAIDKNGNITTTFNSEGMYRGYVDASGKMIVEIYKD